MILYLTAQSINIQYNTIAHCLSPLPGFEPGHVRRFTVTEGLIGYSVFLHQSQLASQDVASIQRLKPHSHIHDLQPRSTTTQQSWSIVVNLQIIFNSRMIVWRVCTSRIEVSGDYDCFENFKTVVVDRRHLHKQVRANR